MKLILYIIISIILLILVQLWLHPKITGFVSPLFRSQITDRPIETELFPEELTLDKIFTKDHTWTATLSAQKRTTLIATGDVIPARSVNYKTVTYKDWKWPFLNTAEFLKTGDVTLINLEAPLLRDCPVTNEGMVFCGSANHIEGLRFAGIDAATTANNHYGNHGIEGINESNQLLSLNGIKVISNNTTKPITHNGVSFLFLNYNEIGYEQDGLDWADNKKVSREISEAKTRADVVVVAFHWGVEYTTEITNRQKELARLAIDSGADLIIGNHPHWIQPVELYKRKFIMYAHGNFVFDQMWSQETREGVVGRYVFYGKDLVDVEYLPVQIDDYGQPHFVSGQQKSRILADLRKISYELKGK